MESILDTISCSRPLEHLYSKKSISPHKLYLVKCVELNMWSRAIIDDFIFTEQKVSYNLQYIYKFIYIVLFYDLLFSSKFSLSIMVIMVSLIKINLLNFSPLTYY